MEKEVVAAKTIQAVGIVDLLAKTKEAEKDGWIVEGNPEVVGNIINQVVIKVK